MRVTYDDAADAAYIQLADEIGAGGVPQTRPCNPDEVGGMVNLDFDASGHLVGIEIMDACKLLPPELLAGAEGTW